MLKKISIFNEKNDAEKMKQLKVHKYYGTRWVMKNLQKEKWSQCEYLQSIHTYIFAAHKQNFTIISLSEPDFKHQIKILTNFAFNW